MCEVVPKLPSWRWALPNSHDTSPLALIVHRIGNFGPSYSEHMFLRTRRKGTPSVIGQHTLQHRTLCGCPRAYTNTENTRRLFLLTCSIKQRTERLGCCSISEWHHFLSSFSTFGTSFPGATWSRALLIATRNVSFMICAIKFLYKYQWPSCGLQSSTPHPQLQSITSSCQNKAPVPLETGCKT